MSSSILSSSSLQMRNNSAFDDAGSPGLNFDGDDPLKENRGTATSASKKPKNINAEIAEIESEIGRLSQKLQALKLKKAQISAASKTPGPAPKRSGRIVPAKFLNPETPPPPLASSASKRIQDSGRRRCLSLGPAEIYSSVTPFRAQKPSFQKLSGIKEKETTEKEKEKILRSARRRGMSLGPSEILQNPQSASPKGRKPLNSWVSELRKGIATIEPKKPAKMNEEIIKPKALFQENKRPTTAAKGSSLGSARRRGMSLGRSASPKGRKPMNSWASGLRKGIATVEPKKPAKMNEEIIKPKALFQENKRPATAAKGRIVASRYNEEGIKKMAFLLGGVNARGLQEKEKIPPSSIMKIAKRLPKIRTLTAAVESPRDSGCAKRVADLAGRRTCFAEDGCKCLSFGDDNE